MEIKRGAFSLLEIVVVIVILGIVSSFSADIFSSIYRSYIRNQIVYQLEIQTSIALDQISKRLSHRISGSAIARKDGGDFVAASSADLSDYEILEWIPYSAESQKIADTTGGWSGFVDIQDSDAASGISSPGGNLTNAFSYINDLTGSDKDVLLVFRSPRNAEDFGWSSTKNELGQNMAIVENDGANKFKVTKDDNLDLIFEHYQLAHEANAIVPKDSTRRTPNDDTGITNKDLWLYYNYKPWGGKSYDEGSKQLLVQNVSMFRFREVNHIMHLKLCLHDNKSSGLTEYVVVCKEKVLL